MTDCKNHLAELLAYNMLVQLYKLDFLQVLSFVHCATHMQDLDEAWHLFQPVACLEIGYCLEKEYACIYKMLYYNHITSIYIPFCCLHFLPIL